MGDTQHLQKLMCHKTLKPTNQLPNPNECFGFDIKPSDGEEQISVVLVNVEYPFTAITPTPNWPGVVVLDRVLYMSQIKQFND